MAHAGHVEIVRKGRGAIADWRRGYPGRFMDLEGADLRGARLWNVNLSGANLASAALQGADLSKANLYEATFVWAKLAKAELSHANLVSANLSYADLGGATLAQTDLRRTNLAEAKLVGAALPVADLRQADLRGADLGSADLRNADLAEADLTGADLTEADLRRANLKGAILVRTVLRGTNLESARLGETRFGGTDLSSTRELTSANHAGPSFIDFETFVRSGMLPLSFLRGCGVPDRLIEYLPSLLSEAIEFYSCFISYSTRDQAFVERLHADLQDKGVRCWFAPEDMKIGDEIRVRIDESIRLYDKLLLILSEDSVESQWVEQEVETALAKERKQERTVLFPIRVDDSVMHVQGGWPALIRNSRHIGDFRRWKDHDGYQQALDRLLRDLKAEDKQTQRAT